MKRYLKTPEEVINALKEGKTIETDRGFYELKDGLFCSRAKKSADSWWSVNAELYDNDKPYINEPEPLKLEVGKFYKTKNGKKAFVFAKISSYYSYPFYVATVGELNAYSVNAKGRQTNAEPLPLDLVAPWED